MKPRQKVLNHVLCIIRGSGKNNNNVTIPYPRNIEQGGFQHAWGRCLRDFGRLFIHRSVSNVNTHKTKKMRRMNEYDYEHDPFNNKKEKKERNDDFCILSYSKQLELVMMKVSLRPLSSSLQNKIRYNEVSL